MANLIAHKHRYNPINHAADSLNAVTATSHHRLSTHLATTGSVRPRLKGLEGGFARREVGQGGTTYR